MIIYVATPYRAETEPQFENQLKYTQDICRDLMLKGHTIIAPHLMYPSFLDDNIKEERDIGIQGALKLLSVCDRFVLGVNYGISEGMRAEIKMAKSLGLVVEDVRYVQEEEEDVIDYEPRCFGCKYLTEPKLTKVPQKCLFYKMIEVNCDTMRCNHYE